MSTRDKKDTNFSGPNTTEDTIASSIQPAPTPDIQADLDAPVDGQAGVPALLPPGARGVGPEVLPEDRVAGYGPERGAHVVLEPFSLFAFSVFWSLPALQPPLAPASPIRLPLQQRKLRAAALEFRVGVDPGHYTGS